ncbi:MAG: hypothetical protein R3F61_31215 [Myxococcota bacterium]
MRAWLPVLMVACGSAEPVQLLDNGAWAPVPTGDPLAGLPCSENAWRQEGMAVEIETEGCSPVALRQTLLEPIEPGDSLEIVWWHDWLFAEEPADGVLSLYVDGALLYERAEVIPGPPAAWTEGFEASVGGAELVLRIDNHGANTWDVLRLTRVP